MAGYEAGGSMPYVKDLVKQVGRELADAEAVECYETLSRVFGNVIQHPTEQKFRTLKRASQAVSIKIGKSQAAISLLMVVGFVDADDLMILHRDEDLTALQTALTAVQDALLRLGSMKALRYLRSGKPSESGATATVSPAQFQDAGTDAPNVKGLPMKGLSCSAAMQDNGPQILSEQTDHGLKTTDSVPKDNEKPNSDGLKAAELIVRITTCAGRSRLTLKPHATLSDLRVLVQEATGVDVAAQCLSIEGGTHLPMCGADATLLEELDIVRGTCLVLHNTEATIAAHVAKKPEAQEVSSRLTEATSAALNASALHCLSGGEVDRYWANGVVGPITALSTWEAHRCLTHFNSYVRQHISEARQKVYHSHVLQPWMYDIACNPSIVGAVASVLQTDTVLLYSSILIARSPGKSGPEETGLGWHADGGGYRPLQPQHHFVTAFVALSPCRCENGCLEFQQQSDGSHVFMELDAGQFSLHSATVRHQATRNSANSYRVCIALRYISGAVTDVARGFREEQDWAVLACGHVNNSKFCLIPRPNGESTPEGMELWELMRAIREKRYGKLG